jgi:hypothetical protein
MKTPIQRFTNPRIMISPEKIHLVLMVFSLFLISSVAKSQEYKITDKWSDNTALVLPKGKWETGVFQSFRYGLNEKAELRSYAFLMPVLPNVGVKFSLKSGDGILLASEHSLSYPTLFLNAVSFKGTGGLISPQFSFPFMLTVSNTIFATKAIGTSSLLTASAGFAFTLRNSKPDYQSTIDIPFIYQRMAQYYEGMVIKPGISFKGSIAKNLYFEEQAKIILVTRKEDNIFVENGGSLMWSGKKSLRIRAGYLFSWGDYPYGKYPQVWPAIDIIFGKRKP